MLSRRIVMGLALAVVLSQTGGCTTRRVVVPSQHSGPSPVAGPALDPGDLVRIQRPTPPLYIEGTVQEYSEERRSILLTAGQGESLTVPFDEIRWMTVFRESRRPVWSKVKRSWLIGLGIAGGGALIALPLQERCDGWVCISPQDAVMGLAAIGGLGYALGGTVQGLFGEEQIWEEIEMQGLTPSVQWLGGGRVGFALSLPGLK